MEKPLPASPVDVSGSSRLPVPTYLFSLCQSLNLIAAVLSVTVAAVVGAKLAPRPELATLPYGLQFAAVMLFTYPASVFMQKHGRKAGFLLGAVLLGAAGGVGYMAVTNADFVMLASAHFLLGMYISFANFYRFAAVDNIHPGLKARAISLVVSGGMLAAIVGPFLAIRLRAVPGFEEYALCYGVLIALSTLTIGLMLAWSAPVSVASIFGGTNASASSDRSISFPLFLAMFSAAGGYLIMNFLMIQSSLVMKEAHVHFNASSHAIQLHVLAMFLPSFFTGSLITRFGIRNILLLGFLLLACSTIAGLALHGYQAMVLGLILLGLGWNFTYVGGGVLLAQHLDDATKHRWQGINDVVIAVCATLGALSPAMLLSLAGWRGSNLVCLAIALAGTAICLKLRPQTR